MKKTPLLNIALSQTIAGLGHGEWVVIGDAGLPMSNCRQRIDLAVTRGVPSVEQVLRVTLSEMHVERVVLAAETQEHSPALVALVRELLPNVSVEWIDHEEFKRRSDGARAVVRTGEFTPYANILLVAGVVF